MTKPLIIIHPRKTLKEDIACAYPDYAKLKEKTLECICEKLNPPFFDVFKESADTNHILVG
jgi:hypothetical protein